MKIARKRASDAAAGGPTLSTRVRQRISDNMVEAVPSDPAGVVCIVRAGVSREVDRASRERGSGRGAAHLAAGRVGNRAVVARARGRTGRHVAAGRRRRWSRTDGCATGMRSPRGHRPARTGRAQLAGGGPGGRAAHRLHTEGGEHACPRVGVDMQGTCRGSPPAARAAGRARAGLRGLGLALRPEPVPPRRIQRPVRRAQACLRLPAPDPARAQERPVLPIPEDR